MANSDDERWMRRAIEIARSKGSDPSTSPLGSVIVLDGKEIAAEKWADPKIKYSVIAAGALIGLLLLRKLLK